MNEWQPMSSAPRDGTKMTIVTQTGIVLENAYWHFYEGDSDMPIWSGFVVDFMVDGKKFYKGMLSPKFWKLPGE